MLSNRLVCTTARASASIQGSTSSTLRFSAVNVADVVEVAAQLPQRGIRIGVRRHEIIDHRNAERAHAFPFFVDVVAQQAVDLGARRGSMDDDPADPLRPTRHRGLAKLAVEVDVVAGDRPRLGAPEAVEQRRQELMAGGFVDVFQDALAARVPKSAIPVSMEYSATLVAGP